MSVPCTRRRVAGGGEDGVPARVRHGELAIAARPVEAVDGEIERAVGGERAQRVGDEARRRRARRRRWTRPANEPCALERDGERVEVEAGDAAVRERRQRRQARRRDTSSVPGDGAARAIEAERGVERELGPGVAVVATTTCAVGARASKAGLGR